MVVLAYKAVKGLAAQYLEPLSRASYQPVCRSLCSAGTSHLDLVMQHIRLLNVANWAIAFVHPRIWFTGRCDVCWIIVCWLEVVLVYIVHQGFVCGWYTMWINVLHIYFRFYCLVHCTDIMDVKREAESNITDISECSIDDNPCIGKLSLV